MNAIEINPNLTILYDKGTDVFGSLKKFTKWLLEDNTALENKKPIDVIKTEEGYKAVMTELMRIKEAATCGFGSIKVRQIKFKQN